MEDREINEKKIQEFLWKEKERFIELVEDFRFPEEVKKEKVLDYLPHELLYNNILRFYKRIWSNIQSIRLVGCEVRLEKPKDSTIRADLLGILEEVNGLVIIELKKSRQTERQSFTELLAYESHIRTSFSPMNDSELIYVLIAPMKERIVKEAVVNSLLYKKQKIFAFQPIWNGNDVNTLRLRPWIPSFEELKNIVRHSFVDCVFDVFKITWEDIPEIQVFCEKFGRPTDSYISIMENLSTFVAQIMERNGLHGFVYAQRYYPELDMPLPNCLVLVGLNPYRATKLRLLNNHGKEGEVEKELCIASFKLSQVLPGIKNKHWNFKEDFDLEIFELLESMWACELQSIGFEVLNSLINPNEGYQTDGGSLRWDRFQKDLIENIMTYNFRVRPVGIIRELYWEFLKIFYSKKRSEDELFEVWETDDIPSCLLNALNSDYMFFVFLERLVNPKWWEV